MLDESETEQSINHCAKRCNGHRNFLGILECNVALTQHCPGGSLPPSPIPRVPFGGKLWEFIGKLKHAAHQSRISVEHLRIAKVAMAD